MTEDLPYLAYEDNRYNYQPIYVRCKKLLYKYDLYQSMDSKTNCSFPPWKMKNFRIDLTISKYKKENTSNLMFKKLFLEKRHKYLTFKEIYTDGALSNSKAGCAFICNEVQEKFNLGKMISIFSAELFAILMAIRKTSVDENENCVIYSDSMSSIQALTKMYSKNPIVQRIQELISSSSNFYVFVWIPSHVGIGKNELVDSLAKSALNNNVSTSYCMNRFDIKAQIRKVIREAWDNDWKTTSDNKLRLIKSCIAPWKNLSNLSRKDSIKITRVRIGHTFLTHEFLMKGSPPPHCQCGNTLTIKHLFNDCVRYADLRRKYNLTHSSLSSGDIDIMKKVLKFLKDLGIYKQI
jgi:ribonuclease HI